MDDLVRGEVLTNTDFNTFCAQDLIEVLNLFTSTNEKKKSKNKSEGFVFLLSVLYSMNDNDVSIRA